MQCLFSFELVHSFFPIIFADMIQWMCKSQLTVTENVLLRHNDFIKCQICEILGFWSLLFG